MDVPLDEHAFDHPSTWRSAPWIWIPKDTLGLSDTLVEDLRAAGVEAADIGASMNSEGVVKVSRNRKLFRCTQSTLTPGHSSR